MPSPDATYPTEMCPQCLKRQAIRGSKCFVCFTGADVDADGWLVKPTAPEASEDRPHG